MVNPWGQAQCKYAILPIYAPDVISYEGRCQKTEMLAKYHYVDVIMTMLVSQITSLTVVYSIVYSGVNQRKHQSSASLAFVREIHQGPVNFPHKWPVTRKMFPFDDVIMPCHKIELYYECTPIVAYNITSLIQNDNSRVFDVYCQYKSIPNAQTSIWLPTSVFPNSADWVIINGRTSNMHTRWKTQSRYC